MTDQENTPETEVETVIGGEGEVPSEPLPAPEPAPAPIGDGTDTSEETTAGTDGTEPPMAA